MVPASVTEYLNSHRPQHLESLCDLLRIPSVANVHDQPDSCQKTASWLADYACKLGFQTEILPCEKGNPHDRPNVFAHYQAGRDKPTLLVYGHYDVQPPDPLELWRTPPFEPTVRDGRVFARGASDDKGQLLAHLLAIEAWIKATGSLPVNVKLFFEGEEEIGSPHLEPVMAANADRLACDAIVVSDSDWFAPNMPSLTYAVRGIAYFELTVKGPATDVHSGTYGGAIVNPVNALAAMIAAMHDAQGRVTIPGFYDDVLPLTADERAAWSRLPLDDAEFLRGLNVSSAAGGEKGIGLLERRWARPTLDCNGIFGGYTGPGQKTIIPAHATAKFSTRLVANQDPEKIAQGVRQFVAQHTPPGVQAEVRMITCARPVTLRTDSPEMRAARAAMAEVTGRDVTLVRCGGSLPITDLFQRILGRDVVLMGFGLPDDNLHAPNEKLDLEQFYMGVQISAAFLDKMGCRV